MSDHDRIRTDLDRARRLGAITFSVYVSSIAALLDERDALAARLDRIEHAARELLAVGDERAWDGFHGPEDIEDAAAALRGALGGPS